MTPDHDMVLTISIITPSFNQGRYLEETIKSVLSQEGDFSLDYIIIDGGSADDSVEVISRYEHMLKEGRWQKRCRNIRYRWVSEKDQGQTDAIMKGFRMAEGEILAWLNSDDTYLTGALLKAVDVFVRDPNISVLYGKAYFTDASNKIIGSYPTGPFDYRQLAMFNFICQPSTFFRKRALTQAGGLDISLHFVMDYDLWIRLAGKYTFKYLPEFISTYRLHEESKTISPSTALANHKEALETVSKYYAWFPLNRVYMHCHAFIQSKLPASLGKLNYVLVLFSLPCAVVRYVSLNRGIRREDLKMINPSNFRKLFKKWTNIYKE